MFVLNTTTKEIEWEWEAQTDFPLSGGGPYPNDWTHVNDIEVLPDGRFMVSLRNQDQVVFLKQGTGLLENQTLGAEDDHDVLYEQHNPDFIPAERGGPAVLVADSENDRVVEYQREGGNWTRTWKWSDGTVDWPRDADRLPNGNTLIVDSNGGASSKSTSPETSSGRSTRSRCTTRSASEPATRAPAARARSPRPPVGVRLPVRVEDSLTDRQERPPRRSPVLSGSSNRSGCPSSTSSSPSGYSDSPYPGRAWNCGAEGTWWRFAPR
ncbi:hypothetical protein ACFQL4_10875 [Halosimplex aquaticum]